MGLVRGDIAKDFGRSTNPPQVLGIRPFDIGIVLQQEADLAAGPDRLLRGGDRARPVDRERQHQAGKQQHVLDWQDDGRVLRNNRVATAPICISHRSRP
jgi:hypothetical protein